MEKTNDAEKFLVGKTIVKAEVDGHGIKLTFDNNYVFDYDASDGGYSCWEIYKEKSKDGLIISRNLCDSCINNRCIFQYGIVRNHCDFYKAESEDKGM